jgi:tRNA (guanine-N7-)-methyltransferase
MRTNKRTCPAVEIAWGKNHERLDQMQVFGRSALLEVDLGCGDGTFLATRAQLLPERNFLGVDRLPGRVRGACRKIGDCQLPNARVLQAEIMEAVQDFLTPRSVQVVHLLFPDPWPKRRHHDRRIVSEEFLRAVADVLVPRGSLRIATDHAEYFAHIQRVLLRVPEFSPDAEDEGLPLRSTFETRFRADGSEIYRLALQRR